MDSQLKCIVCQNIFFAGKDIIDNRFCSKKCKHKFEYDKLTTLLQREHSNILHATPIKNNNIVDAAISSEYTLRVVTPGNDKDVDWVDGSMITQLDVAAFSAAGKSLRNHCQFEEDRSRWNNELSASRAIHVMFKPAHLWLLLAEKKEENYTDLELAGVAVA